jgi:hypothetical protein
MKNNKLKKETIDLISSLYSSWESLEMGMDSDKIQLFTDVRKIINDKKNPIKVYCNDVNDNLKTILIYNIKEKDYTIAMLNTSGLTYIFNNLVSGITLLKNNEIIQENLLFQQLIESDTSILVDINNNMFLKKVIEEGFINNKLINLNIEKIKEKKEIFEKVDDKYFEEIKKEPFISVPMLEEDKTEQEESDDIIKSSNIKIKMKLEDDIEDKINESETFFEFENSLSFNEKIIKLTGLSLLDNSHKGYSEEDKIIMTIDFDGNKSFEETIIALILLSEDFSSTVDNINIVSSFFKVNKNNVSLLPLLMVREKITILEDSQTSYELSLINKTTVSTYMSVMKNNVLICLDNVEGIRAVNLLGQNYDVINNSEILNSEFVVSFSDLEQEEQIISKDFIVGGNLYFKENKKSTFFIDLKNLKEDVINKNLILNKKENKIIKSLNLSDKEFIVSEKHKYVFDNINDLLLGYLENENLHYKNEDRVEDVYLESLFEMKNSYVNEVVLLSKEKKSWRHKNKINRYFDFAKKIKSKLLKFK